MEAESQLASVTSLCLEGHMLEVVDSSVEQIQTLQDRYASLKRMEDTENAASDTLTLRDTLLRTAVGRSLRSSFEKGTFRRRTRALGFSFPVAEVALQEKDLDDFQSLFADAILRGEEDLVKEYPPGLNLFGEALVGVAYRSEKDPSSKLVGGILDFTEFIRPVIWSEGGKFRFRNFRGEERQAHCLGEHLMMPEIGRVAVHVEIPRGNETGAITSADLWISLPDSPNLSPAEACVLFATKMDAFLAGSSDETRVPTIGFLKLDLFVPNGRATAYIQALARALGYTNPPLKGFPEEFAQGEALPVEDKLFGLVHENYAECLFESFGGNLEGVPLRQQLALLSFTNSTRRGNVFFVTNTVRGYQNRGLVGPENVRDLSNLLKSRSDVKWAPEKEIPSEEDNLVAPFGSTVNPATLQPQSPVEITAESIHFFHHEGLTLQVKKSPYASLEANLVLHEATKLGAKVGLAQLNCGRTILRRAAACSEEQATFSYYAQVSRGEAPPEGARLRSELESVGGSSFSCFLLIPDGDSPTEDVFKRCKAVNATFARLALQRGEVIQPHHVSATPGPPRVPDLPKDLSYEQAEWKFCPKNGLRLVNPANTCLGDSLLAESQVPREVVKGRFADWEVGLALTHRLVDKPPEKELLLSLTENIGRVRRELVPSALSPKKSPPKEAARSVREASRPPRKEGDPGNQAPGPPPAPENPPSVSDKASSSAAFAESGDFNWSEQAQEEEQEGIQKFWSSLHAKTRASDPSTAQALEASAAAKGLSEQDYLAVVCAKLLVSKMDTGVSTRLQQEWAGGRRPLTRIYRDLGRSEPVPHVEVDMTAFKSPSVRVRSAISRLLPEFFPRGGASKAGTSSGSSGARPEARSRRTSEKGSLYATLRARKNTLRNRKETEAFLRDLLSHRGRMGSEEHILEQFICWTETDLGIAPSVSDLLSRFAVKD